jgi:hypothetical protein
VFGLFMALAAAPVVRGQTPQFGETTQYFPQFAAGSGWVTTITVFNPSPEPEVVVVEMFRSDGSSFLIRNVMLKPAETQNLRVDSAGPLAVGWAKLSSSSRFNATLLFQFLDSGALVSQAGVLPADVTRDLKVMAVVRPQQAVNTGLAIANPSSINPTSVNVRRLSALGLPLETKSFTLGPLQHFARFLDQPPFFEGIDGYDGTIEVSATEPVVAVSLRLDGVELATVSPITPLNATVGSVPEGAITTSKLASGAVTADKIAKGAAVKTLNSLTDDVILKAGINISITPKGNTLVIDGPDLP